MAYRIPAIDRFEPIEDLVEAGTPVVATGAFLNVSERQATLLTSTVTWDDGACDVVPISDGSITASHTYDGIGVFTLTLRLYAGSADTCAGAEASDVIDRDEYRYAIVYDPDGVFVTGGGWIDSPEHAYRGDPMMTGKATFGFVSKYKKGAAVPTGNTHRHVQGHRHHQRDR
ncbi:MAG: hypothetical protein M3112_04465 [Actinomycetia bacterium]|nr:hypothetical protein [Actinomycetes bacterium]